MNHISTFFIRISFIFILYLFHRTINCYNIYIYFLFKHFIVDIFQPQIIRKEGYPSEAHVVSTEDGYLLTLHRIPGKFNSHPVLLQHGLLGSSTDWVLTGPKNSLGIFLILFKNYFYSYKIK